MSYKPHDTSKSPMTDFQWDDIQADVLATDLSENTKITGLKQLKTDTKVPTKAVNALNEQLGNAQASASDALQRVITVENDVADIKRNGTGGGVADDASLSAKLDTLIALQRQQLELTGHHVYTWSGWSTPTKKDGEYNNIPAYKFNGTVAEYLPAKLLNVKFTNSDDVNSVNVYWHTNDLESTAAGDHVYRPVLSSPCYYDADNAPEYKLHVYKNISTYTLDTTSAPAYNLNVDNQVEIPSDVENFNDYLPTLLTDVTFTNSTNESNVPITWNTNSLNSQVLGPHVVTSNFVDDYMSTTMSSPSITINFVPVLKQTHIYGLVLGDGGTYTDWVRVDEDFNQVDFNIKHGTWAGMRDVSTAVGDFFEIPVTYIKDEIVNGGKYDGRPCHWLSDQPADGFHVHPAFLDTTGQPHPLRISKYAVSKNDAGALTIVDKGVSGSSYLNVDSYQTAHDLALTCNNDTEQGYRVYNIYDHHLLARLMAIECGSMELFGKTIDGLMFGDGSVNTRDRFYGVYDVFGIKGSKLLIYGLTCVFTNAPTSYAYNAKVKFNILEPTGDDKFMDTGVTRDCDSEYGASVYISPKFDGLFIFSSGTSSSNPPYRDQQEMFYMRNNPDTYGVCTRTSTDNVTNYGALYLGALKTSSTFTNSIMRLSQVTG